MKRRGTKGTTLKNARYNSENSKENVVYAGAKSAIEKYESRIVAEGL